MKVAIILPYPVFGAAEDYGVILACGLQQRTGVETVVVHVDRAVPAWAEKALNTAAVESIALSDAKMNSPVRLRNTLRSIAADVVHVNQVFLPGIATGLLSRSLTIVTAHNPALVPRYSRRGRALSAITNRTVDCWIVLSVRNRTLLEAAHGTVRDVKVIAPGLPLSRFERPLTRKDARDKLGLPEHAFIVGTSGRLAQQKRHDLLIRGAAIAAEEVPTLFVAILGDGELRDETQRLADEVMPGRVQLLGHQPEVPTLLPAFDVFALPSDYEGLPFAMLEAMAVGLPVVATDVQGSGEAISNGVDGILINMGSHTQLASAIARLASDPSLAARLGHAAAATFIGNYTADRMVDETELLYRDLCLDG